MVFPVIQFKSFRRRKWKLVIARIYAQGHLLFTASLVIGRALNNAPSAFVLISAAVYQNDGLACASFGGFPALCWVACSLEQRVRGGSVVDLKFVTTDDTLVPRRRAGSAPVAV